MRKLLPYRSVFRQPYLIIVQNAKFIASLFLKNHLIKTNTVSLGIHMKLSHCHSLISGI